MSEITDKQPIAEERRTKLVETLKARGISNARVLEAIASVPRELFVPAAFRSRSYEDSALPIGSQQTISQPYTVAFMTSLLDIEPSAKILEIGTGSGYQAAVLTAMGARVFTIERRQELHLQARKVFDELHLNIASRWGDGTIGWAEYAPFDGIIVTAGSPDVPPTLAKQLAIGGTLVIPVGSEESQNIYAITCLGEENYDVKEFHNFRFVPLIGKEGWKF